MSPAFSELPFQHVPRLGLISHHQYLPGSGNPQKLNKQGLGSRNKNTAMHSKYKSGVQDPRPERQAFSSRRTRARCPEVPPTSPLTNKAPAGIPLTPQRGKPQAPVGETSKDIPVAQNARKSSIKYTIPGSSWLNLGKESRT